MPTHKRIIQTEEHSFSRSMWTAMARGLDEDRLMYAILRIKIGIDSDGSTQAKSLPVHGNWRIAYREERPSAALTVIHLLYVYESHGY